MGTSGATVRGIPAVLAGLLVAVLPMTPATSYAEDTSPWTVTASPNDPAGFTTRLSDVSCWDDGCLAVGSADHLGDTATVPFAVRKSGTASWSPTSFDTPPGVHADSLDAVSCPSADHCLAVGQHDGTVSGPLGQEWDGTDWHRQQPVDAGEDYLFNGAPTAGATDLTSISCPDDGTCFAVGERTAQQPTQTNNAGSGGGYVGMAQRWAPTTGDFVSPDAGTTIAGQPTDSPHGYYSATWDATAHTVQVIEHTKRGDLVVLDDVPGMFGGFSPDDDRFVTESLDDEVATVFLYNLHGSMPSTPTYTATAAVTSSRLAWSPSGHYLFFGFTNATQTFLRVADATASSAADQEIFDTGGFSPQSPPGGSKPLNVAAYGFGPDDSRFMYAFVSGATQVTWRWVDLAEDPSAVSTIQTDGVSGFAQFSPDAQALGLVDAGTGSIGTYVFDTRTGRMIGSTGPATSNGQVRLEAGADRFTAIYGSATYDLGPNPYRRWSTLDVPVPQTPDGLLFSGWSLRSVSCTRTTDCVAVGSATAFDSGDRTSSRYAVIARWNGTEWRIDHVDHDEGTYLQDVSCVAAGGSSSGDACTAVGNTYQASLVMRTDGHGGWTSAHALDLAGDPGTNLTSPQGVTCTTADTCTLVGIARNQDENFPFAETYADGTWSDDHLSHFDHSGFNVLTAVATGPHDLPIAVGSYAPEPGSYPQTLVMVRKADGTPPPSQPQPMRSLTRPVVTGQALLGSVLTAHPGIWSPGDATYSYQWLRGATPISGAGSATYRPGVADIGRTLAIRVTATRSGFLPATSTSPATAVVKVMPTLTAKARGAKRRMRVSVTVKATGVTAVAGKVKVTARAKGHRGTRTLATLRLRRGRATKVIKHLRKGRYTLVLVYSGAGPVLGTTATAKTKVT